MDILDAFLRGVFRIALVCILLMVVFGFYRFLEKIGLIRGLGFWNWLQWPESFSNRLLYVLAIVTVLALLVILDSR